MNPTILKIKIDSWCGACKYMKDHYDELTIEEQSAVDLLSDFWRNSYSTNLKNECESLTQNLKSAHQSHINNRDIITHSKNMCSVVEVIMENEEDFKQFQSKMKERMGVRITPRPSRPAPSSANAGSYGGSHRPSGNNGSQTSSGYSGSSHRPAPRYVPSIPIRVTSVQVSASNADGYDVQSPSNTLFTGAQYIVPIIHFDVLSRKGVSKMYYKLFDPNGTEMHCPAEPGYTGSCNLDLINSNGTARFTGIGNKEGNAFLQAGRWRLEFYFNGQRFCEGYFYLTTPQAAPTTRPVSRPAQTSHQNPSQRPRPQRPASNPSNTKSNSSCLTGCLIPLIVLAAILYGGYTVYDRFFANDDVKTEVETTYHVLAESLAVRSLESGKVVDNLPFGYPVEVLNPQETSAEWARVSYKDRYNHLQRAKVGRYYLIPESHFRKVNNAVDHAKVWNKVSKSYYRLALVDYLVNHPEHTYKVCPSGIAYPNLKNGYDKYSDFAFILTDVDTRQNEAVVYSINDDDYPVYCYSEPCKTNKLINHVSYRNNTYHLSYLSGSYSSYNDDKDDWKQNQNKGKSGKKSSGRVRSSSLISINDDSPSFVPATYPGGESAMLRDLNANLVYPEISKKEGTQGLVILQVQILEDGKVGYVSVGKSLSTECELASVQAVRQLKRFKPARKNGKPVDSYYRLPIRFSL